MKKLKHFKARNESFGKIVFDPNTFEHYLMSNEQFTEFKQSHTVKQFDNIPFLEYPSILYSPVRVYFDLTLLCNLRCRTCLNSSGEPLDDELSLEHSLRVVEGLAKDQVFDVRFSGGEPTLKEGWDQIIKLAKERSLTVSLNSNGIYTADTIEKLIDVDPDEITISLDGGREHNDYIRGKGSWDLATRSIRELHSGGCKLTINSVVTSLIDERDLRVLLELANDFCYDISFFHARPIGRAKEIKDKILGYSQVCELMERIEKMKEEYPGLKVRTRSSSLSANLIDTETEGRFRLMRGGSDGFTRFNIMPNGELYAGGCVLYVDRRLGKEFKLGNIVSEGYSLLNVWRTSKKLEQIRRESRKLQERCEKCGEYYTKCGGFTLEMELYGKINVGGNPFCVVSQIGN